MNVRTLIATAAIVGLSACTAQQQRLVQNAFDSSEPAAAAAAPSVVVEADCVGLTVTTSGWPDGSDGIVGFGSNPPWGAPVNMSWTYPLDNPYGDFHHTGEVFWAVLVRGPGQVDQNVQGTINCDG